jgi:GTP cyclohydrolase IA
MNDKDWIETLHETAGLFPEEGKAMQASPHKCAKCGTGYAGPECKSPYLINPELVGNEFLDKHPGAIVRVGPNEMPHRMTYKEQAEAGDADIQPAIIRDLLHEIIGENPSRGGLLETPARVVKAWKHWTSGYHVDIAGLLKVFEDGAERYDEMVVRKGIRIYSHCEHHMAPIIGECTIAYIPNGRVVGLSKLDRLADAFARRLQVQERLTAQIADALFEHLNPVGVGVHISARHLCVESRGVQQANSDTVTTALRGAMKDQPEARAEFLALVNSK